MKGKATWDWFGRNFLAAVDGADEREWVSAVDFLAMSRGVCPGVYILLAVILLFSRMEIKESWWFVSSKKS
jgi:hypothetical protein